MAQNANQSRHDTRSTPVYLSEIKAERLTNNIRGQPESSAPCYFPNQKVLAEIIVKRIKLLLEHYQDGRKLEDFTDFDFQIYTSRTNTLKEQTKGRLLNRGSGVIPPGYSYEDSLKFAERRVHLYQYYDKEEQRHEELCREAEANPNKLFLIVADEAHWGITKPEEGRTTAHDTLINQWHCDKYKNVIVLLVTATTYNLLTGQSSIPLKTFCAESLSTGELEVVSTRKADGGSRERLMKGEDDVTDKVGPKVSLHQVKWTETYNARLEQGVKMVVRSLATSSRAECSKPIYLGPYQTCRGSVCLVGYEEISEDLTLFVTGKNGRVKIYDSSDRQLMVLEDCGRPVVEFIDNRCAVDGRTVLTDEFEMAMTFGEDIFALYPILSDYPDKLSLYYDAASNTIRAHPKPKSVILGNKVLTDVPVVDLFFVDKLADIDGENEFRYISLNYYYNTIWHAQRNSRKLRSDDAFEELCQNMLRTFDHQETDVFIAEYCIFTIVLSEFVKFLAADRPPLKGIQDILKEIQGITEKNEQRLSEFQRQLDLPKYEPYERYIERNTVLDVLNYHKMLIESQSVDNMTDCWKNFLQASLFGCQDHVSKLRTTISASNQVLTQELVEHLKFLKEEIINSNETGKIIADVMQTTEKNGLLQGSLKVIKVPKGKIALKLYHSLEIAQELASDGSFYNFDIVRDGQKCNLSDIFSGNMESKFRVHLLLQKESCGKNDKGEICPCREYAPRSEMLSIKCANCGHPHNPMQKFEDLQGMPAILILVEKGKMGDTFPSNFNCLDLRIRDSKMYQLSTIVQLLGRLCRHNRQDDLRNVPYALLPKSLIDFLKKDTRGSSSTEEGEQGNALLYSSFMQAGSIDRHVTVDNVDGEDSQGDITKPLNAASSNFDNKKGGKSKGKSKGGEPAGNDGEASNQEEDKEPVKPQTNKIILGAEPQCGKTGTYCYLISSLRAIICKEVRMEDIDGEDSDTEEEEEEEEDDDDDEEEAAIFTPLRKTPISDLEIKWQYPYHGQMRREKLNNKVAGSSKYTPDYGLWSPNKAPGRRRVFRTLEEDMSTQERASKPSMCRVAYKAECFTHKCSTCHNDYNMEDSAEFQLTGDGYSTKLYVSDVQQSSLVLGRILSSNIESEPLVPELFWDPTDLNSWIFIPTAGRARSACLNLKHTMCGPRSEVDKTEVSKTYVQVLVVPEEDFKEYCLVWGSKVTAILQLPESMRDDDEKMVSSAEGGIGFSRRFIHMFALALNLDYIFMMDDNVWFFRDANFKEGKVKRLPDGKVEFQCVPLYKVLSHMERQFHPGTPKPATIFQPYISESLRGLETYTGPSGKYAVLGVRKSRKGSERVKKAFKKAHVYSMILLNVKATAEKDIRYQPWEAFEDLDFNERSNRQDLWVCKYNRFLLSKKIMRTVPTLFFWDADTDLIGDRLRNLAEDENKRLANWVRHFVTPRVKSPYGGENESLKDLFEKVQEKKHGRNTFFAVVDDLAHSATKQDLEESVETLIERTAQNKRNQGYSHYAVVVSVKTCLQCAVTKMADFERLLSGVFKEGFILHVATSHKVTDFNVNVVLLTVQGEDKFVSIPERRNDPAGQTRGEIPVIDVTSSGDEEDVNMETEDPNYEDWETGTGMTQSNEMIGAGNQDDITDRLSEEGIAVSPPRSPSPSLLSDGNRDSSDIHHSGHGSYFGDDQLDIPDSPPRPPSPSLLHDSRTGRTGHGDGRTGHGDGRTGHGDGRTGQGDGRTGQGDGRTGHGDGRTGHGDGRTGHGDGRIGQADGRTGQGDSRTGQTDWDAIRRMLNRPNSERSGTRQQNQGDSKGAQNDQGDDGTVMSKQAEPKPSQSSHEGSSATPTTATFKTPAVLTRSLQQGAARPSPRPSNQTPRQTPRSGTNAAKKRRSTENNHGWPDDGVSDVKLMTFMDYWEKTEVGKRYSKK